MIKRQQRIAWIASVEREYLAAKSAAELLQVEIHADPNYGRRHGRNARDGVVLKAANRVIAIGDSPFQRPYASLSE